MLERLVCNSDKISILQCQEIAKNFGYDSVSFNLCGPSGKKPCKWIDAYLGMFCTKDDEGHFMMVKQFQFIPDVWCEDVKPN